MASKETVVPSTGGHGGEWVSSKGLFCQNPARLPSEREDTYHSELHSLDPTNEPTRFEKCFQRTISQSKVEYAPLTNTKFSSQAGMCTFCTKPTLTRLFSLQGWLALGVNWDQTEGVQVVQYRTPYSTSSQLVELDYRTSLVYKQNEPECYRLPECYRVKKSKTVLFFHSNTNQFTHTK